MSSFSLALYSPHTPMTSTHFSCCTVCPVLNAPVIRYEGFVMTLHPFPPTLSFLTAVFSASLWYSLKRIGINYSGNACYNSSVKLSAPRLWFVGSFLFLNFTLVNSWFYSVVLVSGGHQSASVICIQISVLLKIIFICRLLQNFG